MDESLQGEIDYHIFQKEEDHLECSLDQYNQDINEADVAIDRGEYITHEDALTRIRAWRDNAALNL